MHQQVWQLIASGKRANDSFCYWQKVKHSGREKLVGYINPGAPLALILLTLERWQQSWPCCNLKLEKMLLSILSATVTVLPSHCLLLLDDEEDFRLWHSASKFAGGGQVNYINPSADLGLILSILKDKRATSPSRISTRKVKTQNASKYFAWHANESEYWWYTRPEILGNRDEWIILPPMCHWYLFYWSWMHRC